MHGLHTGAPMRRILLVGVFMLVMLALATHVTVAQADTNTITQTAITSPSDPAYFYDSTGGAYGGFTVSGTTNSTDPSSDTVDIDCYYDDGNQADSYTSGDTTYYDISTLVTGVSVNSSGGFSTTVPYSAIEEASFNGACRLRAVPSGEEPTTGLGSFAGPRVLLAYLSKSFDYDTGTQVTYYSVQAPQLGAYNTYTSLAGGEYDCPAVNMALASPDFFGASSDTTFDCSDSESYGGDLEVDGNPPVYPSFSDATVTVSASQNPSNGDLTIHETEPLDNCSGYATGGTPPYTYSYCDAWQSDGIDDDRTIQQANDGHVVLVTDDFVSTDGQSHQVSFDPGNHVDLGVYGNAGVLFAFPGQDGFQAYAGSGSVDVGSAAPATIFAYNQNDPDGSTTEGRAAITYFTAPSGPITFPSDETGPGEAQSPVIPFTLTIPAGGSQSLSIGYATEYSQADFAADLQTELDLKTAPTITISSPGTDATESSSSVNVSGSVTAATGVESVSVNGVNATVSGSSFSATVPLTAGSNTITAVVAANSGVTASATESVTYTAPSSSPVTPSVQANWAGPLWLPIADTGTARGASAHKEKLSGRVTPGSAGVAYYFEYGTRGHLSHRSKMRQLAASKTSHAVALSVGGLSGGTKYIYRLVATGKYGHSAGASRTFKVAKRGNQ
jgi:hypothetical protein